MAASAQRGTTLLELLVALALVALLASVGYPHMRGLTERSAQRAALSQLQSALTLARHTAITRSERVFVCPRAGSANACGLDWSRTLLVVTGDTRAPLPAERIVRALPDSDARITYNRGWRRVRFSPLGHSSGHNGTFTVCPAGNVTSGGNNTLVLSQLGRIRVTHTPDGCAAS
ncbi:GspH/FimT family pseudopilin [Halomonas piscis]|uniref:Type II secretion system protein H n=1 Tax=Halomonas piscis TaxID=3031727 RepID=A0ABY9Z0G5_9GAMM|nr:GspH/FimT family pseudopilin [Halomonas piscis]WNK20612.1 GspH/FimT family pseudopilin [Halomonas piscis]